MIEFSIDWDSKKFIELYKLNKPFGLKYKYILIIGILCLFNKYLISVGVLLIVFCLLYALLSSTIPSMMPIGFESLYRKHNKHMHEKLTYGFNEDSLWVKGKKIEAKCSWTNLLTWQLKNDWLILRPSGMPQLFFPISKLQKEQLFEKSLSLSKKHGQEFR